MDDIKNPPSPFLRHHRPGLTGGGVTEDGVALASEWDILKLEARQGGVVCLYIWIPFLAGSHGLEIYPLLDGFDSGPGECIRHLIVFSLYVLNIGGEFGNVG